MDKDIERIEENDRWSEDEIIGEGMEKESREGKRIGEKKNG